ncbi:major tail protein [Mangrovibacillus cuniculi]|uniref:Phage tail protein n=1 Tax=Mangrovibacillus cuniculi TaxID=2593652 RepID=A0A7S8CBV1_9BACI|nr:major tail protein [Mangrovibacillus cuniculi]QPC47109.1 phage tail protein [Mangrovibacillus cuniculi]
MTNKVTYGLSGVHFAPITETNGTYTYDTPVPIPGGVSLTINPVGERSEFFADNIAYHIEETNNGYDGELNVAAIPDVFKTDVLGETLTDGVMYEKAGQKGKKFALLFQFEGDKTGKRHVLYSCTAARPTVGSTTKTTTTEVQTTTLTFSARPRPSDNMVKANTTADVSPTVYDTWFTEVHEPTPVV